MFLRSVYTSSVLVETSHQQFILPTYEMQFCL